MYFEKFDVIADSYYTHQYAQDVMYAQNQGEKLRNILEGINATEYEYTFVIPLYENMPTTACKRPSTTRTNSNTANNSDNDTNSNANTSNINNSNIEEKYELGDLDGNNKIDAMDMYNIIQYILGKLKLENKQIKAADMNNDNKIDAMDMYLIIQKIKNN